MGLTIDVFNNKCYFTKKKLFVLGPYNIVARMNKRPDSFLEVLCHYRDLLGISDFLILTQDLFIYTKNFIRWPKYSSFDISCNVSNLFSLVAVLKCPIFEEYFFGNLHAYFGLTLLLQTDSKMHSFLDTS